MLTLIFGYAFMNRSTWFLMSGTQVQNVRVVSVSMALSMSAWGICEADAGACGVPPEPESPLLQAASNQALVAAPAVPMRNLRRSN